MGKVLKILAVAGAIAVAVFAPTIALAAAAAIGIKTAVAVALITAALVVGASVVSGMLTRGAPKPSSEVGPPAIFRQSISNSFIIFGLRRVGGLLAFFHPRKSGSDHYRYFVVAVAGHRCKGVVSWMLNDEIVTVDGSGKVTSGPYANACWLWFQRGLASETANATFVSECGGKWTAAHKGNGIAAFYAKFKMTDAVVQAGMPNMTAVIEGRDEIRDPRDGALKYTRNATLVSYDFMAMPREEGGYGAYRDEIPDDDLLSAWANVCDETVEGEERYALDAVITTGAPPGEVRDLFVVNQAGSYAFCGGLHLIRPGYYVPPADRFGEEDLAGPIQVSAFLSGDQVANEVQGTFVDPNAGYQGAPFATQSADADDIRQLNLELAFVTSKYRAERIAAIMLRRAIAEKTVIWPINLVGLNVQALDTLQLDSSRYGLSNYVWSVTKWDLSADFNIVLALREEGPEIYEEPGPVTSTPAPAIAAAEAIDPFVGAPSMPDIAPVTIEADYLGSVLSGQLPRNVLATRLAGGNDVTPSASWSLATESGTATATIGAATGVIEVTALASTRAVLVATSELGGVSLQRKISLEKHLAGMPISGGGGTPSIDTSFNAISSATHAAISDELEVVVGASGQVDLAATLDVFTAASGGSASYPVFGLWRWWNGSSWADVGTEVQSSPDCGVESGLTIDQGSLSVVVSKTGLTTGASAKFKFYARNASGTRTMTFSGSAGATPA